jgi:hypothetical protein
MLPPRLPELRLYYNTTIRPELLRLEGLRRRILRGMAFSLAGILLITFLFLAYDLGFLLLIGALPVLFYVGTLYLRIERFRQSFKPAVVRLLLDFINETPNFRSLAYEAKRPILRDRFERSGLFRPHPDSYRAEDYIRGLVGEMAFEMGETYVQEVSPASNRLQLVFSGLFVHAKFNEPTQGRLAVWPRHKLRRLKRSVDAYVGPKGRSADVEILNAGFRERYAVYAHPGTKVAAILTPPMQDALLDFAEREERDLYFAVHDQDLFIGLEHGYDLLEPHFFRSNVSFQLIRQFYGDIMLMLLVIQDFDQTH